MVDRDSEEAETIRKYVKNTHATTHNAYDLEVVDVRTSPSPARSLQRGPGWERIVDFASSNGRKRLVCRAGTVVVSRLRVASSSFPVLLLFLFVFCPKAKSGNREVVSDTHRIEGPRWAPVPPVPTPPNHLSYRNGRTLRGRGGDGGR